MFKPYTIRNHPTEALNGEVHFRNLSVYDSIQIGVRKALLCNGARFDDLPENERALLHIVATLEQAITRAPKGFYDGDESKGEPPILNPGRLSQLDDGLLFLIYRHYQSQVQSFRREREGGAGKPGAEPADAPFAVGSAKDGA